MALSEGMELTGWPQWSRDWARKHGQLCQPDGSLYILRVGRRLHVAAGCEGEAKHRQMLDHLRVHGYWPTACGRPGAEATPKGWYSVRDLAMAEVCKDCFLFGKTTTREGVRAPRKASRRRIEVRHSEIPTEAWARMWEERLGGRIAGGVGVTGGYDEEPSKDRAWDIRTMPEGKGEAPKPESTMKVSQHSKKARRQWTDPTAGEAIREASRI